MTIHQQEKFKLFDPGVLNKNRVRLITANAPTTTTTDKSTLLIKEIDHEKNNDNE